MILTSVSAALTGVAPKSTGSPVIANTASAALQTIEFRPCFRTFTTPPMCAGVAGKHHKTRWNDGVGKENGSRHLNEQQPNPVRRARVGCRWQREPRGSSMQVTGIHSQGESRTSNRLAIAIGRVGVVGLLLAACASGDSSVRVDDLRRIGCRADDAAARDIAPIDDTSRPRHRRRRRPQPRFHRGHPCSIRRRSETA